MAVVMMKEKKMLKGIFKKNVEEEALLIQIQSPFLASGSLFFVPNLWNVCNL